MYGQKHSHGEKFYDSLRPYIEITDEVYCEREVFQMYSLLRYSVHLIINIVITYMHA